jgi:uncharacterized protein (DUF736 family)
MEKDTRMSNYDNTNTFIISKNQRKEKDTHPDYTGNVNVDGAEFWLNGWIRTKQDGTKFISGSIKAKDAARKPIHTSLGTIDDDLDGDDSPF